MLDRLSAVNRNSRSAGTKISLNLILCLWALVSSSGCAKTTASLSGVYKAINPAVVVIHTAQNEQKLVDGKIVLTVSKSLGSGVIVDNKGSILTAAHVVQTADKLLVKLTDGNTYRAKVVSSAVYADLALIRIENPPESLTFVTPGDSDKAEIGEPVFVIGTPYGIEHTLTVGYLSGRHSQPALGTTFEFLQTDAAINKGNSGGPLFTHDGELIGIVSYIQSESGGSEGLGFAASINMAKELILDAPEFWGGLEVYPIRGSLAKAFNLRFSDGLLVQKVAKDSVADKLGLRAGRIPIQLDGTTIMIGGDMITRIEGHDIYLTDKGITSVFETINQSKGKEIFSMKVIRAGEEIELTTAR